MGERVFICREANERSWWSGIGEGDAPGGGYRLSPSFASVFDAIAWWQERGNDFILVRLDDSEYLWAGDGPVPVDGAGNPVARRFVEAVDEERSIGATQPRHVDDQTTSTGGQGLGKDLRQRRMASGLAREVVAQRMGVDEAWLRAVEEGSVSGVDLPALLGFVGATSASWPDRHPSAMRNAGWVQRGPLSLAMAIRIYEQRSPQ